MEFIKPYKKQLKKIGSSLTIKNLSQKKLRILNFNHHQKIQHSQHPQSQQQQFDQNIFKAQINKMKFIHQNKNNSQSIKKFKQKTNQTQLAITYALVNLKKNQLLNTDQFQTLNKNQNKTKYQNNIKDKKKSLNEIQNNNLKQKQKQKLKFKLQQRQFNSDRINKIKLVNKLRKSNSNQVDFQLKLPYIALNNNHDHTKVTYHKRHQHQMSQTKLKPIIEKNQRVKSRKALTIKIS